MTHYDPRLEKTAVRDPVGLYYLTEVLSYAVGVCFLRELGIPPERRTELFKRNRSYDFAASEHPKV